MQGDCFLPVSVCLPCPGTRPQGGHHPGQGQGCWGAVLRFLGDCAGLRMPRGRCVASCGLEPLYRRGAQENGVLRNKPCALSFLFVKTK